MTGANNSDGPTAATPGPWIRKGNAIVDREDFTVLRGTTFQDEETRANLDLAAAAPDMLHALMAVEEMLANPEQMPPEFTRNELLKSVRAALRKAKPNRPNRKANT